MSWGEYIQATKDKLASQLLIEALEHVQERKRALDLGAGGLKDTRFLLQEGFETIDIVDASPEVVSIAASLPQTRINMYATTFDEFDYEKDVYDLINAQYSLPFNNPTTFLDVWNRMIDSLKSSGIFVGQLFGTKDEWSDDSEMVFHTGEEAERLLEKFSIIKKVEEKGLRKTVFGKEKYWHVFHIIAKKK